jgi:hypothetical protein
MLHVEYCELIVSKYSFTYVTCFVILKGESCKHKNTGVFM